MDDLLFPIPKLLLTSVTADSADFVILSEFYEFISAVAVFPPTIESSSSPSLGIDRTESKFRVQKNIKTTTHF